MNFLVISALVIGIIFMLTFMFIGIWLFIIALKTYNKFCYNNYILEKINENLSNLNLDKEEYSYEDFLNDTAQDEFNLSDLNNVKDFGKRTNN